jgi:hypothetical protein
MICLQPVTRLFSIFLYSFLLFHCSAIEARMSYPYLTTSNGLVYETKMRVTPAPYPWQDMAPEHTLWPFLNTTRAWMNS